MKDMKKSCFVQNFLTSYEKNIRVLDSLSHERREGSAFMDFCCRYSTEFVTEMSK